MPRCAGLQGTGTSEPSASSWRQPARSSMVGIAARHTAFAVLLALFPYVNGASPLQDPTRYHWAPRAGLERQVFNNKLWELSRDGTPAPTWSSHFQGAVLSRQLEHRYEGSYLGRNDQREREKHYRCQQYDQVISVRQDRSPQGCHGAGARPVQKGAQVCSWALYKGCEAITIDPSRWGVVFGTAISAKGENKEEQTRNFLKTVLRMLG